MTSRERVMAALAWQQPDRIPIFNSFWGEFRENWAKEKGFRPEVSIQDYYGIDIQICTPDETPYPSRKQAVREDARETISRDGYGRLLRERKGAYFRETLEALIRTPEDLDRNPFDPVADDARYERFLTVVEQNRERRCCFCKVGGPYLRTTYIRGETEFLMDIAQDPVFAKDLADRMGDFLAGIGV